MARGTGLALLVVSCARPTPPPRLVAAEDLTETRLDAIVAELVPLIEQETGFVFTAVPHARIARATDLDRIVESEARATFRSLYPDLPDTLLDRAIRPGTPQGISGKYAIHEQILLVDPHAMVATASAVPEDPDALEHVVRLVLAHELAHALQDQVADLDARFLSVHDSDGYDAVRMLTEGHANVVEKRVAARIDATDAARALDEAQGWDASGPKSSDAYPIWALYGQGQELVRREQERAGVEGVRALLTSPPTRTRTFFRPEELGREQARDPTLEAAFERYADAFGDVVWFATTGPLHELVVRHDGFDLPGDVVGDPLADVVDGASTAAFQGERQVEAHLLRFASVESATSFFASYADSAGSVTDGPLTTTFATAPVELEEAAVSVVQTLTYTVGEGEGAASQSVEVHRLVVRRGDLVLVARADGFRPGLRLRRAAEAVLARLP